MLGFVVRGDISDSLTSSEDKLDLLKKCPIVRGGIGEQREELRSIWARDNVKMVSNRRPTQEPLDHF